MRTHSDNPSIYISIYLFIHPVLFVLLTTFSEITANTQRMVQVAGGGGGRTDSIIGKCNLVREGKGRRKIKWRVSQRANNSTLCKYLLQQLDWTKVKPAGKKWKNCQWKIWSTRAILPIFPPPLFPIFFFSVSVYLVPLTAQTTPPLACPPLFFPQFPSWALISRQLQLPTHSHSHSQKEKSFYDLKVFVAYLYAESVSVSVSVSMPSYPFL